MAASGQDCAASFAALMRGYNDFQVVYEYLKDDIGTQSPVAMVVWTGTRRERLTARGSHPLHLLEIHLYTIFESTGDGTTELNANQTLSNLEEIVAEIVDRNQRGINWNTVSYGGPMVIETLVGGGMVQRRGIIPLEVRA